MGVQPKKSSRLFIILGAVLTLLSMGGVYVIANSSTKSASSGAVSVLVASREIPVHTIFSSTSDVNTWLTPVMFPSKAVPVGALSDAAAFQRTLLSGGKQATSQTIFANEPVLSSMFTGLGSGRTGYTAAFNLPKNDVAVSMTFSQVNASAGGIQPGDYVDLLASFLPNGGGSGATDKSIGSHPSQTQFVLQNLKVLSTGTLSPGGATSSSSSGTTSGGLMTFEVGYQTALILQHLKDFSGSWATSVVLRSAYSKQTYNTRPVNVNWFFRALRNNFER